VIPLAFDYVRAGSAAEAVALLTEHGDEAKLLAGGHSLLPLMKLRLATPAVLVDVARIDDLAYVRDEGAEIAVGALTRHHVVERDALLVEHLPLLAHATSQVGDRQVRHRGTLGGALAHGDPASDLPAVALALGATLVAEGPNGRREIGADDFFTGFLETALAEDELLVEIRFPKATGAGWSFQKFTRRSMDWAIVGVAAVHAPDGVGTGIGLVNMDSRPVRASASEAAAAGGAGAADAAASAAEGLEPPDDANASVEFRAHLARVLVERALDEAGVGAGQ
jgi:carbon-monoxide dehydrogenase medium subunit